MFVDCDPDSFLIDAEAAPAAITERTKAIVPVHLYGQLAPVEELLPVCDENGVFVVEDAAQSQGARRNGAASGSIGHIAATSFYPGKNLGAYGDAGAVTTGSEELAATVRPLSQHGSVERYVHSALGLNSRLDGLQAVVLRAKLPRLAAWNAARVAAADYYAELLAGVEGVGARHPGRQRARVAHLLIRVADRDRVVSHLRENGVGAAIHYPIPVHRTGAFANPAYGKGAFPNAEQVCGEILSCRCSPASPASSRSGSSRS